MLVACVAQIEQFWDFAWIRLHYRQCLDKYKNTYWCIIVNFRWYLATAQIKTVNAS